MTDFRLTPPEPRGAAPGTRITDWLEAEGKTVRYLNDCPAGKRDAQVVIVFEDECWMTIFATPAGACSDEGADLSLVEYYGRDGKVTDYLSPRELLEARLINQGTREHLEALAAKEKQEANAKKAADLRKRADDIEAGKGWE